MGWPTLPPGGGAVVLLYAGERVIAGIGRILEQPKIIISLRELTDRLSSADTFQRIKANLDPIRSCEDYLNLCREQRGQGSVWQGGRH